MNFIYNMNTILKRAIILVFLMLAVSSVWAQCPMCKTALESARDNGSAVGSSLNNGILYLLALPYSVAMVFGIMWYRKTRQKQNA